MHYNETEFQREKLNEKKDFNEFASTEKRKGAPAERFFHEDEYNRNAYVKLGKPKKFKVKKTSEEGVAGFFQKTVQVLKVRAMTIAVSAAVATSPAAEKAGVTYPGASDLLKPDGTPILEQTHQHNFDGWKDLVPPDCENPGERGLYCTDCEEFVKTIILPAHQHSESDWIVTEPGDCHTPRTEIKECTRCGVQLDSRQGDTGDHIPGDWIVDKEATCLEDGQQHADCTVCGQLAATEIIPAGGHTESDWITDSEADCEHDGVAHKECTVCGEILAKQMVDMTGHTPGSPQIVTAATCVQQGSQQTLCTKCGILLVTETIPQTGHKESGWITDQEATCTTDGLRHKECTVCGTELASETIAAGHTTETVRAVEATCTTDGLTEGSHCSVCGEVITAQTVVPALGHDMIIDRAVAPTCTETGLTEGSHCSRCDNATTEQQVVEALGHTPEIDPRVEPTCDTTGLTEGSHCSVCGEVIIPQEVIPALGHDWQQSADDTSVHICANCGDTEAHIEKVATPRKEATCTEAGNMEGIDCSVCGYGISQPIDIEPLGHDIVTDRAVEATCTSTGLTEGSHCSRCDEATTEQQTVEMLPHTEEIDRAVEPTCTDTGLTEGSHCSVCNTILVQQTVIEAAGHTASEWITGQEPTCETEGYRYKECTVCGEELERESLGLTEHKWVPNGDDTSTHICENCGATETHSEETVQEGVEPTCETAGISPIIICPDCNYSISQEIELPALGHDMVEVPAVEPTCTEAGNEAGAQCSRCDYTEGCTPIEALGHNYEPITNEDGNPDYDIHQCTNCGETFEHEWITDEGSHSCDCGINDEHILISDGDDSHSCEVCGYSNPHILTELYSEDGMIVGHICDYCGYECSDPYMESGISENTGEATHYCITCHYECPEPHMSAIYSEDTGDILYHICDFCRYTCKDNTYSQDMMTIDTHTCDCGYTDLHNWIQGVTEADTICSVCQITLEQAKQLT